MNSKPLVSVITVVYNGEKHLRQTIESIIGQTYTNIEYIIIDGGSTDGTLGIIKQYEEHISYWVSEPDNGLYDAMNKGISIVKGKLIGMVNSDDWFEPNTVELIVGAWRQNPECTIFHGDRFDIPENGSKRLYKFNQSVLKLKYLKMTYNHPGMFVTKEEYCIHRYNSNLRSMADFQFVLESYVANKNKFCYIEKPLCNFRLGGVSAQLSRKETIKEAFVARKNAGFSLAQNLFAVLVRFVYWIATFFLALFRKLKLLNSK